MDQSETERPSETTTKTTTETSPGEVENATPADDGASDATGEPETTTETTTKTSPGEPAGDESGKG